MPGSTRTHGGLRLLAMLAVAILVLGLPQLLRTCDHGDHRHLMVAFGSCEHTHDELAASPNVVAGPSVDRTPGDDGDDERAPLRRHEERRGTSNGPACEPGVPPRPFALVLAAAVPNTEHTPWLPPATQRRPTPPPPATGPPRPDDRTALRLTMRLQV